METKTRIFTADANIDFCKMLERIMAAENDMELVGNAADGVEALAMVAQLKPDILLLDLVLPKLDGLEVLRRLPETGAKPHVIVLSGFVNTKVVTACSSAGADFFFAQALRHAGAAQPNTPACRNGQTGHALRRL